MSMSRSRKVLARFIITQSRSISVNRAEPTITSAATRHFCNGKLPFSDSRRTVFHFYGNHQCRQFSMSPSNVSRIIQQLTVEEDRDRQRERHERIKAGLSTEDIDAEEEEDYMGVKPLIEKLEKQNLKLENDPKLMVREEPTDSDSDEDDERFSSQAITRRAELHKKKCNRHEELVTSFANAETMDAAYSLMKRIDAFEEKHLKLRLEYRVIGELLNRLKEATTGKEKFLLQVKLNRALRLVQWREANDPENPENFGFFNHLQKAPGVHDDDGSVGEKPAMVDDGDEVTFNEMKDEDDILLEKLNAIDKTLQAKLAELDHTFGRRGKALEAEIRDLAEDRNALTEKRRRPLYRKGFDVKMIDVNRTSKVTKGGRIARYSAILACGNYQGIIGYGKAKGPNLNVAVQKAHEKCFQNLHYVDRHEDHTIAHAIQTSYKKTKLYLWPAATATGLTAGKTVQTVLSLAGYKNVKSKVIGSRNPHNTLKAIFKALNAIETPKDVEEKFGRTVVESYLL